MKIPHKIYYQKTETEKRKQQRDCCVCVYAVGNVAHAKLFETFILCLVRDAKFDTQIACSALESMLLLLQP